MLYFKNSDPICGPIFWSNDGVISAQQNITKNVFLFILYFIHVQFQMQSNLNHLK